MEIIGDLRPNFFPSSFHEGGGEGGGREKNVSLHFGQKYRRINFSSRRDANDSNRERGGEGGGAHTRVQSTLGCIEAYSFESAGPILDTCLQIVEDIFLASGKFFSSISVSLAHSLSLILPFTKGTEFLSRMYTLTFATFLLYVHVYTMKRFLARLSVSS